ncbi:MAG: ornithine aminomutase subunit alpha [Candidatus Riflebacteria bacterium]|nr:ornithine aminomutase subunit alpha [Candidatus Riflebacteria bacterium]
MSNIDRMESYRQKRDQLSKMTDDELKDRFWNLANKLVEPMVQLAKENTSPSIERSVLLRMGLDSITSKAVVEKVIEAGLLGKGAGNVLLRVSQKMKTDIPGAAKALIADKNIMTGLFGNR